MTTAKKMQHNGTAPPAVGSRLDRTVRAGAGARPLLTGLRECADEVMRFPHPSQCDHMHDASALMRQAANLIERHSIDLPLLDAAIDVLVILRAEKFCPARCEQMIDTILERRGREMPNVED
jgi:hypothetical protein